MNYNVNSGYGQFSGSVAMPAGGQVFMVAKSAAAGADLLSKIFIPDPDGRVRFASTLAGALTWCVAGRGDIVYVAPGHTETIAAATTFSAAGVKIIGVGQGDNRPTFTFSTSTAASFVFGSANMAIENMIFIGNIASQVVMLDFSGQPGCQVSNCLFEGTSTTKVPLITIKTDASSDDIIVTGNQFLYSTVTSNLATEIIRLVGVDNPNITGNYFSGNVTTAIINNITTACNNVRIQGNTLFNLATTTTAGIAMVSGTTGIVSGNTGYSAATDATYSSTFITAAGALIQGNTITNSLGTSTSGSTSAETCVVRATGALAQTGALNLFAVAGGPVQILSIIGEVTTVIQTQADNTKLKITDTAASATVDICAVTSITAAAVGTFFSITGTAAGALVVSAGGSFAPGQANPVNCPIGIIKLDCAASNTGSVRWFIRYRPMAPGAVVTAL